MAAGGGVGGATGRGGATGCCVGAGGVATWGAVAGRGVPQYPQNLLPKGNDLWHVGHIAWGTAGVTKPRIPGTIGVVAAGDATGCCGFPQRAHVAADAGFMLPQDAQRM